MQKGSMHFARIGTKLYSVIFETKEGPPVGPRGRTFATLDDLEIFLHLVEIPLTRILPALRAARCGGEAISISDVVLCDHELRDFAVIESPTHSKKSSQGRAWRHTAHFLLPLLTAAFFEIVPSFSG